MYGFRGRGLGLSNLQLEVADALGRRVACGLGFKPEVWRKNLNPKP